MKILSNVVVLVAVLGMFCAFPRSAEAGSSINSLKSQISSQESKLSLMRTDYYAWLAKRLKQAPKSSAPVSGEKVNDS